MKNKGKHWSAMLPHDCNYCCMSDLIPDLGMEWKTILFRGYFILKNVLGFS